MRKVMIGAGAALLAIATPALGWSLLGSRHVGDALDHDRISLDGKRQFARIRLCAYKRPVHLLDLKVHFANGAVQDVAVRNVVKPGACTRNIDLVGTDRNIASVDLTYEANTRRRGTGAEIRLFGE